MRKVIQPTLFLFALLAGLPALGATAADFYVSLLRRGAADVEAGRNAESLTTLRLAAFGLVDSIPEYETALAYLTVAHDRLAQQDRVRDATMRILAAERVERRFASLSLPATIRGAFETAARKVLTATEVAALTSVTPPASQSTSRPVVESPSRPAATTNTTTTTTTPPRAATTTPTTTTPPAATNPTSTSSSNTPNSNSSSTRRPDDSTTPPKPAPPKTQPQPAQPTQTQPARPAPVDVPARLAAAERALGAANLVEARRIYRELLEQPSLEHGTWIRVAEGLYRSRDFANTLTAFQRAGALRPGEEAYRYYIAVASYETGQYERARRELAAALPHIELTPDVQRYRAKIEGAR